jgi:hypothetical protein
VLAKEQDVTRAELDQADDALRRADAALDGAQQAIAQAQSAIAMHQAAQARATAALATAEWRLARTRIVAPTSGTINKLTVRVGDTAAADVPLIGIVDAHAWRIVANYKESFIRSFETGATPGCGSVPSRGPCIARRSQASLAPSAAILRRGACCPMLRPPPTGSACSGAFLSP